MRSQKFNFYLAISIFYFLGNGLASAYLHLPAHTGSLGKAKQNVEGKWKRGLASSIGSKYYESYTFSVKKEEFPYLAAFSKEVKEAYAIGKVKEISEKEILSKVLNRASEVCKLHGGSALDFSLDSSPDEEQLFDVKEGEKKLIQDSTTASTGKIVGEILIAVLTLGMSEKVKLVNSIRVTAFNVRNALREIKLKNYFGYYHLKFDKIFCIDDASIEKGSSQESDVKLSYVCSKDNNELLSYCSSIKTFSQYVCVENITRTKIKFTSGQDNQIIPVTDRKNIPAARVIEWCSLFPDEERALQASFLLKKCDMEVSMEYSAEDRYDKLELCLKDKVEKPNSYFLCGRYQNPLSCMSEMDESKAGEEHRQFCASFQDYEVFRICMKDFPEKIEQGKFIDCTNSIGCSAYSRALKACVNGIRREAGLAPSRNSSPAVAPYGHHALPEKQIKACDRFPAME